MLLPWGFSSFRMILLLSRQFHTLYRYKPSIPFTSPLTASIRKPRQWREANKIHWGQCMGLWEHPVVGINKHPFLRGETSRDASETDSLTLSPGKAQSHPQHKWTQLCCWSPASASAVATSFHRVYVWLSLFHGNCSMVQTTKQCIFWDIASHKMKKWK